MDHPLSPGRTERCITLPSVFSTVRFTTYFRFIRFKTLCAAYTLHVFWSTYTCITCQHHLLLTR
jgi:hypothetical protein